MKLLILGGSQFLGRHLVLSAEASGHEVTLFNRGQTNPELFPDTERIQGDRDGGLNPLKGRTWDTVLDVCGYVPRIVRDLAAFIILMVDHQMTGLFNATGPATPLTWGQFFDQCEYVCQANTELTWISEEFLRRQEVGGEDLPFWLGSADQGVMQADCSKAIRAGLRYDELARTILDTRVWDEWHGQPKAGLSLTREGELLDAWMQQQSS